MNTTARQGILYRLFAGGIPITALLTAIFYLQGKAYQAGFLHYFHIESTQMAITTADAMWNAYRGWGNGAATVLLQSRDLFIRALFELAPLVLIASLLAAASMLLFMRFKKESPNNSRPHPPVKTPPRSTEAIFTFFLCRRWLYIQPARSHRSCLAHCRHHRQPHSGTVLQDRHERRHRLLQDSCRCGSYHPQSSGAFSGKWSHLPTLVLHRYMRRYAI